jgi:hypothetical protein
VADDERGDESPDASDAQPDDAQPDEPQAGEPQADNAEPAAAQEFKTVFRGYERAAVRAALAAADDALRGERERVLAEQLVEALTPPEPPPDPDVLLAALSEEITRVLRGAREAAGKVVLQAQERGVQILRDGEEAAARIRGEADAVLSIRSAEADKAAARRLEAAERDLEVLRTRARAAAEVEIEAARTRGKEMIAEAQAVRERVLRDLVERRKAIKHQIERLLAGRERLLTSYDLIKRTVDEATGELVAVEPAPAPGSSPPAAARADVPAHASHGVSDAAAATGPRPVFRPGEPPPDERDAGPAPVPATPATERRTSALRIVRRGSPSGGEEPAAPHPEPEPADASGQHVRIVSPPPSPEQQDEDELVALNPAVGDAAPGRTSTVRRVPPRADVEELFARLRADQQQAETQAHNGENGRHQQQTSPPAPNRPARVTETGITDADEAALQRRDRMLEPIEASLARKLKRALQDEQNLALDALRTHRGRPTLDAILPPAAEHVRRYRQTVLPFLERAAEVGVSFGGGAATNVDGVDLADLAQQAAEALVEPLRAHLDDVLVAEPSTEEGDVVERIGARYREWKLIRMERAARDAAIAAFSRGAYSAAPYDAYLRWVVDDDGNPCPECDDDALAGPVPKGEPFPTGQHHPPAHTGCRCLLVRARA